GRCGHGPRGRQLRHDRQRRRGRKSDLQQHAGIHLLPDLLQHRRDRHYLLRHPPRPPGAPDPPAPPVGKPCHRRPAGDGARIQPTGPGRHEQAASPQGRTHHVQVAPHAVPADGTLRWLRHPGSFGSLVPGPWGHVVSATQLEHVHGE
ncbi:unnamed protein product, partial [Ectocarpus sp. 4 AP-2014]